VWQGVVAGGAVAVALAARPFALHGLVEAFDLAVRLRLRLRLMASLDSELSV
jgi:hypothetical protein